MNASPSKTSPLVIAASVAVIVFCVVGIAALTGVLPGRSKQPEAPVPAAQEPGAKPGEPLLGPLPQPGHAASRSMVPPPGSAPAPGMVPPPGSAPVPVCTTCGVITS
ncbi:MAG: hypothetical protein KGI47_06760, partial [Betaproteobacteria bacterium]|nr:hypothetical protein [Betaproteobacteria bacterium]